MTVLEALEKIPDFAKEINLKVDDFLKIHEIVMKETLENPGDEGVFRNRQVYVVNGATGEIVFSPPSTKEVPKLVKEFLDWFNSQESSEIDPVLEAGVTHYEIVRIHLFIDGNGRTSRIIATLVLYKRDFDVKRFFALDDYYDKDRRSYYTALNKIDQKTLDLTDWLEYFTEGVATSISAVKDKVIGFSKDIKILKERGQIALTEKQMKIVEWVIQNEKITNGDVRSMFKISDEGALKEIKKLLNLKIIKSQGRGRALHYVLQ